MITPESHGNYGPVLNPPYAVLNPHSHRSIEPSLFLGQLSPFGLFERELDLQARDLLFLTGLGVAYRDYTHLLVQALIAFVSMYFASIGQSLKGADRIAEFLVVNSPRGTFTDGYNSVVSIGDKLSLECNFFLPE